MKHKMISRLKSLLVPHICWNIIAAFFLFALQTVPFTARRMQVRDLVRFDPISIFKGLTYAPYDGVLWTMFQLLIFALFAPVFYDMLKNHITAIVLLVLSFVLMQYDTDVFFLIHGNASLFSYLVGAYIGMHFFDKVIRLAPTRGQYILAVVFFVGICIVSVCISSVIINQILIYLGIIDVFVIAHGIAKMTVRSSELCYGLSLWIYALHNLLQPCFSKIWLMTGVDGNAGALVNTFIISLFTVVICMIMAKSCKRLMPRTYSLLSGGRG